MATKGCYRLCAICGKEFLSINRTLVCSEVCKAIRDKRTSQKIYQNARVKELRARGQDVSEYEVNHYAYKKVKQDEVDELKRLFSAEERKKKQSCMFCPDVNSVNCGRAKWEGRITGGCWKKVPDERCRR